MRKRGVGGGGRNFVVFVKAFCMAEEERKDLKFGGRNRRRWHPSGSANGGAEPTPGATIQRRRLMVVVFGCQRAKRKDGRTKAEGEPIHSQSAKKGTLLLLFETIA